MKKPIPVKMKCYQCHKEKGHLWGSLKRRERFCSIECFNAYWDKALETAIEVAGGG